MKTQKRTTWSKQEIETIKEWFPIYKDKEHLMGKLPNKSWNAILNKARKDLKLKKTNRWEKQKRDDMQIKQMINKGHSTKYIAEKLNLPMPRLYKRIANMNMKPNGRIVTNDMKKLLNDSNLTGYWLGFILADGSFPYVIKKMGSVNCALSFWLSKKDKQSVIELAEYLGVKNIREQIKTNSIGFVGNDIKTLRLLFEKLGMNMTLPKTYNPPTKLGTLTSDFLFSLIIGYIDGDGCIKRLTDYKKGGRRYLMAVRAHSSWMPICDMFDDFLYKYFSTKRTSKANSTILSNGYSLWSIRDNHMLLKIKTKIDKLNLPAMKRKWDKIY